MGQGHVGKGHVGKGHLTVSVGRCDDARSENKYITENFTSNKQCAASFYVNNKEKQHMLSMQYWFYNMALHQLLIAMVNELRELAMAGVISGVICKEISFTCLLCLTSFLLQ